MLRCATSGACAAPRWSRRSRPRRSRARSAGRGDAVERHEVLSSQGHVQRAQVRVQLLDRPRADGWARDAGPAHAPGHRQLTGRAAFLGAERLNGIQYVECGFRELLLARAAPESLEARAGGWRLGAPVAAGQEAAGGRRPGVDRQAIGLRHRNQLALDAPVQQVIRRLLADEAVEPPLPGCPERLDVLPGGHRAGADVAHLAGPDQLIQRA